MDNSHIEQVVQILVNKALANSSPGGKGGSPLSDAAAVVMYLLDQEKEKEEKTRAFPPFVEVKKQKDCSAEIEIFVSLFDPFTTGSVTGIDQSKSCSKKELEDTKKRLKDVLKKSLKGGKCVCEKDKKTGKKAKDCEVKFKWTFEEEGNEFKRGNNWWYIVGPFCKKQDYVDAVTYKDKGKDSDALSTALTRISNFGGGSMTVTYLQGGGSYGLGQYEFEHTILHEAAWALGVPESFGDKTKKEDPTGVTSTAPVDEKKPGFKKPPILTNREYCEIVRPVCEPNKCCPGSGSGGTPGPGPGPAGGGTTGGGAKPAGGGTTGGDKKPAGGGTTNGGKTHFEPGGRRRRLQLPSIAKRS